MGFNLEAAPGPEKFHQTGRQRVFVFLCGTKSLKIGKIVFASGIERSQAYPAAGERLEGATGQNADRKVHGDRAGMKEVQRPDIHGAARQIDPAGRMRGDGIRGRQRLFRKEVRHLAELVVAGVEKFFDAVLFKFRQGSEENFIHKRGR